VLRQRRSSASLPYQDWASTRTMKLYNWSSTSYPRCGCITRCVSLIFSPHSNGVGADDIFFLSFVFVVNRHTLSRVTAFYDPQSIFGEDNHGWVYLERDIKGSLERFQGKTIHFLPITTITCTVACFFSSCLRAYLQSQNILHT
jgi:hypothetical protein